MKVEAFSKSDGTVSVTGVRDRSVAVRLHRTGQHAFGGGGTRFNGEQIRVSRSGSTNFRRNGTVPV